MSTPRIDRWANGGMKFLNAYAMNANNGPSRADILTGTTSNNHGFTDSNQVFDETQWTFNKALQDAGYWTSIVGEYMLNSIPNMGGWDDFKVLNPENQGDWYTPTFNVNGQPIPYPRSHISEAVSVLTTRTLRE